ncbi:DNA polymerase III subunit alpha [Chromatiales bacterium (ex Bugula neritina AB1)]|nr:DNA polymerase III subunit alpha [Chromatiales bacterium (ex Bugula neritina AB1)]
MCWRIPVSHFVHLRVHTEFSLVDSVVRIGRLMSGTAAGGMPAVALTDQSNMFALIKFYRAAIKAGVKPIIGVDALVDTGSQSLSPIVLLAQTTQGYLNLSELVSRSYQEGQDTQGAILQYSWFEGLSDGIIALSGGRSGDIGQSLLAGNTEEAQRRLEGWQELFPERFYLELQRTGRPDEERYIQAVLPLASEAGCPVVATNDVRFLQKSEFEAHEVRVCIHQGHEVTSTRRPRIYSEQQYLKSAAEMADLFADIPAALENSVQIAMRCNLTIRLGDSMLPDFPVPPGSNESDFLRKQSEEGLNWRLSKLYDTTAADFAEIRKPYDARLARELDVIIQMEFPGYFLIVSDFIKWSRDNDIPVGPGRGSGAGSLVAYALAITDLDPLAYDLLFERFLNPERVSMPDFDIDFCMDKRDQVIQYVAEKYGSEKVSQIITYGTMAAKAVVRDVARVMGHPYGFGDRLAKMVPLDLGITLTKAIDASEELRRAYNTEEDLKAVVDMALQLEGLSRNAGKHAGGVVIAPTRLTDFTPLYCEADGSSLVTQFDKDDAEAVGLVKFDFLGLRTLTIIDNAVKMINNDKPPEQQLVLEKLPFDDGATFELLQQAKTTGVFQLESGGMKKLIAQLKPDCFDDVVALVALYRPGPMSSGMLDDFIARKNGRAEVSYPHPDYQHESLKPILESTYGVIVYQEQVMQIGQVLAGYSLGGADVLRRAMGKKKPEEMAKQRQVFVDGCSANNIDEKLSSNIFDLVEKFAGYGFNKSHSVAYAVLSYQTAWLKRHYPAEFFSAVLTADMDATEKVVRTIDDCLESGLKLLPPDINKSETGFTPTDSRTVRFGLAAIKGVGEGVLDKIIGERRRGGKYRSLIDLCGRLGGENVGRSVLECLIRAGALDCLGENRATAMNNLGLAITAAQQAARNNMSGQVDMFGNVVAADTDDAVDLVRCEDWSDSDRLAAERKTTGLYISGHPIDPYVHELTKIANGRIIDQCERVPVPSASDDSSRWGRASQDAVMAGLVSDLRVRATNRGSKIMTATLDDRSGKVDVVVSGDLLDEHGSKMAVDTIVVVEGGLGIDSFSGGYSLRARQIYTIDEARERFARLLLVTWRSSGTESLQNIQNALAGHRKGGRLPVFIDYTNDSASARIRLGDDWQINPSPELLESLNKTEGVSDVDVVY